MNKKSPIFVANWKMQLPFAQALQFCTDNKEEFKTLSAAQATLILCPSYEALCPAGIVLCEQTAIKLGGQNCSQHLPGAYTGQVSAQSLAELGCTYCIIGHSECRTFLKETDMDIARKAEQLLINGVIPIVCVGETLKEYEQGTTFELLAQQLEPVLGAISNPALCPPTLLIAYEPVWSIGTGVVPSIDYLTKIFDWLAHVCAQALPNTQCMLLYGGSVTEISIIQIREIKQVNGYLIGGASLDFQKFKKIVSLGSK